jgi:mycothiol synthase
VVADAPAVTRLIAACEIEAHGEADIIEDETREFFARPGVDLDLDVVVVLDGDAIVGYADVHRARASAFVAPSHRGRGIGTALVEWTLARARECGFATVGQTVSDDDPGAQRLLRELGARTTYTAWILRYTLTGTALPPPVLPPDVTLRAVLPGEERSVFATIETAFSSWPEREPETFEDWAVGTIGRRDWEPWLAQVAVDGARRIVGVAMLRRFEGEGWVDQLAVTAERRREGIGRALLHHAFHLFDGLEPAVGLSTDSRTGALGLYLAVGMTVRRSYTRWTFDLAAPPPCS